MKNIAKKWFFVACGLCIAIALVLKIFGVTPWISATFVLVAAIVGVIGIFKDDPEEENRKRA